MSKNLGEGLEKPGILEVIVVEGRDDVCAVKNAVQATVIATHGFHINGKTWKQIENAYEKRGIIVLTDPDFAGEQIRKRIKERFPDAKQAFLPKREATKGLDIGVENATPESIREALEKVKFTANNFQQTFTEEDMLKAGLSGAPDSAEKREKLGKSLGIGYANARGFLKKLNEYSITREEFYKKIEEI